MAENPFTPTFGTVPYVMAGRDELLSNVKNALSRSGRDPLLSTLLIGARGTGKTALLTCIRQEAEQAGWVAVNVVALPGMLEDVYEQAMAASSHLADLKPGRHLTSVTIGPLSAEWEAEQLRQWNWRTRMTGLLDQLAESGVGLLITVDEAKADLDELIKLVSVYQLFITEGRKVALVMAGLPYQVHRLVTHKSVSFLRRAFQYNLKMVARADVETALVETFGIGGKAIGGEALKMCSETIGGFPYLLQLVGYRVWEAARRDETVSIEAAERGIEQAMSEMDERIIAATFRELSPGDVRYLQAMLQDKRESRTADISSRMGVSSGYAAKYKSRLLAQGVIGEPAKGWVAFEIPGFKEYLIERISE
ncbi:MAG: ATP-binding protein [Eggerthellaceae bacterium]|nr:ATP-binding protein [Eggerthellaceae bacterium]